TDIQYDRLEDLAPTEDDDLGRAARERERLLLRTSDLHAVRSECHVPGHHDVGAFWQWAADRVVGSTTHDERLAGGELAHVRHVVRQMPGQASVLADDLVAVERQDERDTPRRVTP